MSNRAIMAVATVVAVAGVGVMAYAAYQDQVFPWQHAGQGGGSGTSAHPSGAAASAAAPPGNCAAGVATLSVIDENNQPIINNMCMSDKILSPDGGGGIHEESQPAFYYYPGESVLPADYRSGTMVISAHSGDPGTNAPFIPVAKLPQGAMDGRTLVIVNYPGVGNLVCKAKQGEVPPSQDLSTTEYLSNTKKMWLELITCALKENGAFDDSHSYVLSADCSGT